MITNEQLEKLPKWARKEIISLRLQLQQTKEALHAVGDKTPTRIRWGYDNAAISESYGYIRDIETIFFTTHPKRGVIRARLVEGGMALNLNADCGLSIEPYSTNDVVVRVKQ